MFCELKPLNQSQALADAERQKAVLEIKIKEQILEKEGQKNVSTINNEIRREAEQNEANIAKKEH